MRVGGLARGPCPPHPPGLGSPIPDGSLAAPAPCPAAAASRAAVPAPPSGSVSAGQTGERPGSWEPGAQWPDRFAHLVPALSQQACPVPVPCAQLSRTGDCRRPPPHRGTPVRDGDGRPRCYPGRDPPEGLLAWVLMLWEGRKLGYGFGVQAQRRCSPGFRCQLLQGPAV